MLQVAFIIDVAIYDVLVVYSVTGSRQHDMEGSARIPAQMATSSWLLKLCAAVTLSKHGPIREMNILLVLVRIVKNFRRYGWFKDL